MRPRPPRSTRTYTPFPCTPLFRSLTVYIGAMLVGAGIRNFDDRTGWVGLSVQTTDLIGNVCLALFLAVALMNLKLWELSGLALPLIVNLGLQVALVVLFCVPVFRIMGDRKRTRLNSSH